jgi:hypothetical protein
MKVYQEPQLRAPPGSAGGSPAELILERDCTSQISAMATRPVFATGSVEIWATRQYSLAMIEMREQISSSKALREFRLGLVLDEAWRVSALGQPPTR